MADSVLARHPIVGPNWVYEWGLACKAILEVWRATGEDKYFEYVKTNVDRFVMPDGSINTYDPTEYRLDDINAGKLLFPLYAATGDDRYRQAANRLREQLRTQPRTKSGGFWHNKHAVHQMWLDGIYMATPFLMEFAAIFGEPDTFDDAAHQIVLIEQHTRDPHTNLLYHGWAEAPDNLVWADPHTGQSPNFWGRATGWYMMALVDALDFLPADHPQRARIGAILDTTLAALAAVRDQESGLWYQVLDQGGREGNYLEASASCMIMYAMLKSARCGCTGTSYVDIALESYDNALEHFVEVDDAGLVNLNRICFVAALGGKSYRDGSFKAYISEEIVTNDFKGVGPFILASVEVERHRSA
ncbi:MAG: glycoside hydrolase family 88 protein [Anaerolineae bacterium]|nr:glycoside hydrolase family 88 protein [Anaerolineae bacterium]